MILTEENYGLNLVNHELNIHFKKSNCVFDRIGKI